MNVKKRFTSVRLLYTVNINSGYAYSIACGVIGGKMQDYFLESLKLQRIDFFLKLVAASECSDEERGWLCSGFLN
ncbi:Hypothetical protein WLH_05952 [Escherichia coli O25b:H4]|uniref:Uncharacterized protein n=1 Tax=Escherichia coli O25b:H4 TaxID=941280 RepID=A0A192CLY7_ECO25|nr:Hypothetical protein WLH_05952 [Escherichia coli O25b:H4]